MTEYQREELIFLLDQIIKNIDGGKTIYNEYGTKIDVYRSRNRLRTTTIKMTVVEYPKAKIISIVGIPAILKYIEKSRVESFDAFKRLLFAITHNFKIT